MNNRELCHLWANKSKDSGKGSNMFFEHGTIYSYGYHFPIAKWIDEKTIFLTYRGYSHTTAKHISYVRRAIHGHNVKIFNVYDPVIDWNKLDNMNNYTKQAKEELERYSRARIKDISRYQAIYSEAADYAKKFKVKNTVPKLSKKLEKQAKIDSLKAIQKKKEETKNRIAKQAADLELWKQGENIQRHFDAVALRIEQDEIVTTLGARVPVNSARLLYLMLKSGRPITGEKVGYYTVNSVNDKEIKIGCHTIPMAEIERIGQTL